MSHVYLLSQSLHLAIQVKQVAQAISYIHGMGIVHGNIVPVRDRQFCMLIELMTSQANVMIDDAGVPCLCDVGLGARLRKVIYSAAWPVLSNWPFKAPEELSPSCDPSVFSVTKEMDVYAFASTLYAASPCASWCLLVLTLSPLLYTDLHL